MINSRFVVKAEDLEFEATTQGLALSLAKAPAPDHPRDSKGRWVEGPHDDEATQPEEAAPKVFHTPGGAHRQRANAAPLQAHVPVEIIEKPGVGGVGIGALGEPTKPMHKGLVSKSSVQYTDNATNADEQCRFCQFFNVQPYTCQRVTGSVSPEGWCELYKDYGLAKADQRPGVPAAIMAEFVEAGATPSDILGVWANVATGAMWVSIGDWATTETWKAVKQVVGSDGRVEAEYSPPIKEDYTSSVQEWLPLEKHCGVCEEDDAYAGAPIAREITIVFPNDHHANGVEIIAMMAPGLTPKPALWKPEGGEDEGLIDWIGGPQYPREEAAYRLDRSLGFYLVPVAYVAEADDEKGAAVYYTENALPPKPPMDYSLEWIEKAGILDYLICQKDRGYKHNYLTHPDEPGRMVLYDNGLSFPADGNDHCNSPFANAIKGQPLSSEVMTALSLCLGDVICWARIIGLVGPVAADAVRDRIQYLLTEGWPGAHRLFNEAELRKEFHSSEHPRDSHGRFGEGGGGVHPEPTIRPDKPQGKRGTGKWGKEGGSYRRVRENARPGDEIHHMPAAEASPLNPLNGPAIAMPKSDHMLTASYGTTRSAREYRAEQRKLISEGKFHEAQQRDIDDIRSKFGDKYDKAINEMKNYTSNLKFNKNGIPNNPTPKQVKAGLA